VLHLKFRRSHISSRMTRLYGGVLESRISKFMLQYADDFARSL
jgi:hypothetical protein